MRDFVTTWNQVRAVAVECGHIDDHDTDDIATKKLVTLMLETEPDRPGKPDEPGKPTGDEE